MLKPTDIQQVAFVKAVFGGYDMQSVDEFLDQVGRDYQALTTENSNLKQKLRLLVQKLEEYRAREDAINQAQVQAAAIIADAERKAAQSILNAAPVTEAAPAPAAEAVVDHAAYDAAVAQQEQRVANARLLADNFIAVMHDSITKHLTLLDELKTQVVPTEGAKRPYDYESEADPAAEAAADPADEIARNVSRFYGDEPASPDETKVIPRGRRFEDLQFGPNYNPRA